MVETARDTKLCDLLILANLYHRMGSWNGVVMEVEMKGIHKLKSTSLMIRQK